MEEWKKIESCQGRYEVSRTGEIRNQKTGRLIKNWKSKYGYNNIRLPGLPTIAVHRLVAVAFIPNPLNKPEVHHVNSIRNDNKIENLEWVSSRENNRKKNSCKRPSRKISPKELDDIFKMTKEMPIKKIATIVGIDRARLVTILLYCHPEY